MPEPTGLHRGLSARQVQMIAIAGTIGTGLFLGTGKSLSEGGPASMLICYALIGFVVYITLLLLGEMATQYPVAGSFNAYATRFFSPSYGFALSWNYWFNDAVSVASDLTAAQLVIQFWTPRHTWVISLLAWVILVSINALHVRAYGELEYWLAFLKVVTIVLFIILGVLVNVGVNTQHTYIGTQYWSIPGAPFVNGFSGFANVFVTASFAFGGTESLGITAGETRNPSRNMPKVVKFVFWRILLFYVLSILLIGLNVPWDYPNLSNKSTATSPFTIVFKLAGSTVAASSMNTVILTSVFSAGNHALFTGTRVLYGLSVVSPRRQAPAIFSRTTSTGVPIFALLATSSISILCFASSFFGSGQLWGWLQNIVGVSNQIAWLSIGLASWRFRKAWIAQNRSVDELKFYVRWTWPWGPYFVIITVVSLILIQGWSSVFPTFSAVNFISLYIEIPIMIVMYTVWALAKDIYPTKPDVMVPNGFTSGSTRNESTPLIPTDSRGHATGHTSMFDIVDICSIDLYQDEHVEDAEDELDEEEVKQDLQARFGWLWRLLTSVSYRGEIVIYDTFHAHMVTLPEWLTGSPATQQSGWSLTASVRIAQVTFFCCSSALCPARISEYDQIYGGDSDDDEPSAARTRARAAADGTAMSHEELDVSNLINPEEASKRFRKAERARRHRTRYAYPPSPSPSSSRSSSSSRSPTRTLPLPARLRALQAELAALEAELEDPSNPALQAREKDGEGVDPGEMIRGLVDVRRRLEKVRRGREGRGRLVGVVVGEGEDRDTDEEDKEGEDDQDKVEGGTIKGSGDVPGARSIVEMDKRVGELEKLVGSVSATLDEATPLTPPLLPMLMRLNNQLTLLTQPRHIDSVSRRLKLLLSDLERVSASQIQKRQQANGGTGTLTVLTPAQDAVLPLLSRLAPSLPHIPHILTRLRTLSALHGSAAEFQSAVTALEEEQRRTREALEALNGAVANVEGSLEANRTTVAGNVSSLEDRVERVLNRLEEVTK
ncbi:amino acid permease-domain-containing protein [Butyriboletus roseoflavus]|nr:amino acid permease-domain-containing protein [Butyriboletus roseoflavus]